MAIIYIYIYIYIYRNSPYWTPRPRGPALWYPTLVISNKMPSNRTKLLKVCHKPKQTCKVMFISISDSIQIGIRH